MSNTPTSDEEHNQGVMAERKRAIDILALAGENEQRRRIAESAVINGLSLEQARAMIEKVSP